MNVSLLFTININGGGGSNFRPWGYEPSAAFLPKSSSLYLRALSGISVITANLISPGFLRELHQHYTNSRLSRGALSSWCNFILPEFTGQF